MFPFVELVTCFDVSTQHHEGQQCAAGDPGTLRSANWRSAVTPYVKQMTLERWRKRERPHCCRPHKRTHHFHTHHLSHTYTHTYMIFLRHTPSFTYHFFTRTTVLTFRSFSTSFVFPSFPVPATTFGAHYWKKLTCGVIRSLNSFFSNFEPHSYTG